uniref:Uncharacterized protein n=1 Tax=viral metagenome TaxID=1070528 RepID=A0A6H2A5Q1_9ZZZZ
MVTMSCEICGGGICTRIERINGEYIADDYYVKLADVIDIIEDY